MHVPLACVGNLYLLQFALQCLTIHYSMSTYLQSSVTPEAETLSIEVTSKPKVVNGSTVLVPANRVGLDGESVIRLSCTVVNQGRFTWTWSLPDSVSSSPPLILDATRTSVIEVPRRRGSVGKYSCSARYYVHTALYSPPPSANFTIKVECESICVFRRLYD